MTVLLEGGATYDVFVYDIDELLVDGVSSESGDVDFVFFELFTV